jgi:hypothetical protein
MNRKHAFAEFDTTDDDAPAQRGEILNKQTFAKVFGLTIYAVEELLKRGLPVHRHGSRKLGWEINSADALAFIIRDKLVTNESDPDAVAFREAKLKKTVAEIVRIEAENKANRDNRITAEEAVALRRDESNVIRLHLNRVPGRVAAAAAAETNASNVEDLVADEINAAMTAICNDGVEDHDHDSEE